jgi:hypothetical protein
MKVLVQTPIKNNARIIGKESFVINDGSAQSQYMALLFIRVNISTVTCSRSLTF